MNEWYFAKNGQQSGPVSVEDLRARFGAGSLNSSDLVWCEGMSDWKPLGEVAELAASRPASAMAASSPPVLQNSPDASSSVDPASPYGGPVQPNVPTNGLAVASLCCGIASFLGFWILTALPAVICGHMARGQIRESHGGQQGSGMALAGLIMGYLMIALTLLLFVVGVGFFYFSVSA